MIVVLILSVGLVTVYGECQTSNEPIENCCCLGYNNNNFNAKSSGVYTIANFCGVKCSNTKVYCDTSSGGGGWTVIQRRRDGSVDFNKDWTRYEDGFGYLNGEFWIGLRSIHCLTSQGNWELRIDFQLKNGTESYLHYNKFTVGSPEDQYPLNISGFDSTGLVMNDPFTTSRLNGMKFTTRDRENDFWRSGNCGQWGGWWYNGCSHIYINSEYGNISISGTRYYPAFVEMKIRPQKCKN